MVYIILDDTDLEKESFPILHYDILPFINSESRITQRGSYDMGHNPFLTQKLLSRKLKEFLEDLSLKFKTKIVHAFKSNKEPIKSIMALADETVILASTTPHLKPLQGLHQYGRLLRLWRENRFQQGCCGPV